MPDERHDARWWLKAITPPIVVIAVKGALRRVGLIGPKADEAPTEPRVATAPEPPEFEVVPEGFEREVAGWDGGTVADAYASKWPEWVAALEGPGPLGVYHEARAGSAAAGRHGGAQHAAVVRLCPRARRPRPGPRVRPRLGRRARALRPPRTRRAAGGRARLALPRGAVGRRRREEGQPGRDVPHRGRRARPDVRPRARVQLAPVRAGLAQAARAPRRFDRRSPARDTAPDRARGAVLRRRPARRRVRLRHRLPGLGRLPGGAARHGGRGLELDRELLLDAWMSPAGAPEHPIGHRGFLFRPVGRDG